MFKYIALLCLIPAILAVDEPKFPKSFQTDEVDNLVIAQGGFTGPDGSVCCSPNANCKVQTESQQGINYFDGEGNQTRFDDSLSGQIIVTQYAIGKQMLVAPNLTCLEYCPTETDFDTSPFWPTPGEKEPVHDMGKAVINGVECHHFKWFETIVG